jgi:hypothetical protein
MAVLVQQAKVIMVVATVDLLGHVGLLAVAAVRDLLVLMPLAQVILVVAVAVLLTAYLAAHTLAAAVAVLIMVEQRVQAVQAVAVQDQILMAQTAQMALLTQAVVAVAMATMHHLAGQAAWVALE